MSTLTIEQLQEFIYNFQSFQEILSEKGKLSSKELCDQLPLSYFETPAEWERLGDFIRSIRLNGLESTLAKSEFVLARETKEMRKFLMELEEVPESFNMFVQSSLDFTGANSALAICQNKGKRNTEKYFSFIKDGSSIDSCLKKSNKRKREFETKSNLGGGSAY